MRNANHGAYAIYALLGLVWGATYIFNKIASQWLPPMHIVLVRVVMGFLPVLLFALSLRALRWWHLRHLHHFAVMSLLAATLYYYAFAAGVERLPSSVAGMLSGSIPLFSFLGAALFLRGEPIRPRSVLGLACGFAGVMVIARPWSADIAAPDTAGMLFILAGSASVGLSFVYARRFLSPLGIAPIALCTYQLGLASALLLALCDIRQVSAIFADWRAASGLFLGAGLFGTGIAYTCYYYLVERLGAIRAASVTYIPPVVALVIGATFAGESLAAIDIVAAAIILLGVFVMQSSGTAPLRRWRQPRPGRGPEDSAPA
ncbi:DMT family transporter [Parahaliea mediterranea]|uniref:DMT family transporter n=1 Tax=Parahaliea mediterranea TaxID=651086 RepID=A0A939DFG0_9GAMM|nr:DMT family transporter [Parahaliea mediterranea]MBN7797128.1 DMT family transporter [Parahaliea mediterranea]